jgi:hypothetical protein
MSYFLQSIDPFIGVYGQRYELNLSPNFLTLAEENALVEVCFFDFFNLLLGSKQRQP